MSSKGKTSSNQSSEYKTSEYITSGQEEDRGRALARSTRSDRTPSAPETQPRPGYHTFECLGRTFHVEDRWKLVRELGQGAYGLVVSVQDEISGEAVAVKLITRVFDKLQLAKRALREITLLRHFNDHDNITGLIDMDIMPGPDYNEIYLFMEPMEADLHQIVRTGQALTSAHIQYFLYQILRGVKYMHSANVIHRDLKPGNLLVNSDCELKICDLGLSRGYDADASEENVSHLTEYVATRWYRAPEIMLSFRRYTTAIDVWSIGCILAELLGGKPLFKGKDYVDQLNLILNILGTPKEATLQRIGSEKAQAYIRSLPIKRTVPFSKLFPNAEPSALDLLAKLLAFDPHDRITVQDALRHEYLSTYHELNDEPECPEKFEKWREIEELETIDEFRAAIAKEVQEFRTLVRTAESSEGVPAGNSADEEEEEEAKTADESLFRTTVLGAVPEGKSTEVFPSLGGDEGQPSQPGPSTGTGRRSRRSTDPYAMYARRASLHMSQSVSPAAASSAILPPTMEDGLYPTEFASPDTHPLHPTVQQDTASYFIPGRSRAASSAEGTIFPGGVSAVHGPLLRQLSTLSVHDTVPNGGLAGLMGLLHVTPADAPPSSLPVDFKAQGDQDG